MALAVTADEMHVALATTPAGFYVVFLAPLRRGEGGEKCERGV
jgi:hypothetical protein